MKTITFDQHGGADNLKLVEVPRPQPQGNEVLLRLHAAALNHVDIWVRKGGPAYPVNLPHVLGADGAGIVEELGPEAEGVSLGERMALLPAISCGTCFFCKRGQDNQCQTFEILGTKRHGTYAEYVCVPDQNVIPIPDSLSFESAAAYPLAYLTAWHMLFGKAKLQAGEKVLIVGASAGVAVAGIQLAKWKGAEIYAATTSPEKVEKIKLLGAKEVFVTDGKQDMSLWIHKLTDGRGVDVVFEHVGPATWEQSVKSLSKYGRLVTCGATTGPTTPLDLRYLFSKDLNLMGARMGTQKEFQQLSEVVFRGEIKPVIDKVFPLDQAAEAHAHMEAKKQLGKILLAQL